MLWRTLYNRIGTQPMTFSNHKHVKAIIGDNTYYLDIKYDVKGQPYLVEMPQEKVKTIEKY